MTIDRCLFFGLNIRPGGNVNQTLNSETSRRYFDAIKRVGVAPARSHVYPGAIKFEVGEEIPIDWLLNMSVELNGQGLMLRCSIRAWDTVGRFYGAFLDPGVQPRTSITPPPNITRCTAVTLIVGGERRELLNDITIFGETEE